MSKTAATMTKTTTPITPAPSSKSVVHLKSSPLEKSPNHSNSKVNNNNNSNNNNDDNNSLFSELDSEIAKMSADADAILESIRLAASSSSPQPVTPGSSSSSSSTPKSTGSSGTRKKLTLSHLLEGQKQDALYQKRLENNNDDDDDMDDDDMTDDGSVPEQVRLDLAAELREVENSFIAQPSRLKKEIMPMPTTITTTRTTTKKTTVATKTAITAAAAATCTPAKPATTTPPSSGLSSSSSTMVWIDLILVLMIILTWTIIACTMYSIMQENYMILNDKGEMILFSSSIQDILFSSSTTSDGD